MPAHPTSAAPRTVAPAVATAAACWRVCHQAPNRCSQVASCIDGLVLVRGPCCEAVTGGAPRAPEAAGHAGSRFMSSTGSVSEPGVIAN